MSRLCFVLALGFLMGTLAEAQRQDCATAGQDNAFLGIQTIRLWPGEAPQAKGTACQDTPTLTIFEPQHGHDNGSAVVILPGGSYEHLAAIWKGRQICGLVHGARIPGVCAELSAECNGYLLPVPLLDARRAVQIVRARARRLSHRSESHCGDWVLGGRPPGGAGGDAVSDGNPDAEDPIDRVSSRPDFLVLGYPWIGAIYDATRRI